MFVIEANGLTKFYGKHRGIIDLNLKIQQGDYFGFIGPNGAGKSTTIRTLLGLIKPSSGYAKVMGKDISNTSDILAGIGYMPSEAMFYGKMKVKEIISLSARLRKKDCTQEAKILCDRLNLDINKRIDELSLGNRKKVAIVCAMQHKPKLYILDEPTSGLDPLMQKEFFDLLGERNKEGASIFLSSHILSEIQSHCNRAAIIKEGKLIADGSVEELSKTNAKRITLHGVVKLPNGINAKSVNISSDSISFLYNGDIKELLNKIILLPIKDLTINEPALDEIFLHYYEKAVESNDNI